MVPLRPAMRIFQTTSLLDNASALCRVVAEEFGLVGVNGIDFIGRGPVAYAIEVNPRWSASMELVERAYGLRWAWRMEPRARPARCLRSIRVCAAWRGRRRQGGGLRAAGRRGRRHTRVASLACPSTRSCPSRPPRALPLEVAEIRDVPHPGERIPAGRPVCTVLASGSDSAVCHAALGATAPPNVRGAFKTWEREVAWTSTTAAEKRLQAASDVLWNHLGSVASIRELPEAMRPPTREAGYAIQALDRTAACFALRLENRRNQPGRPGPHRG